MLPRRPELKLIVTSATLDAERFSQHFTLNGQPAPVIEVSGRLYPIETRWRPIPGTEGTEKERDLNDAIVDAVDEARRTGPGDVLVFLPGEREIREAAEALRKHGLSRPGGMSTEILPLFARQSAQEQARIFAPHQGMRVVLATNVAETSLTVPGIRYVVDAGLARIKRYSHRNKVEQLLVEPVSRAAAHQRAGRCGRVASGICFRLYDEEDFNRRPAYTDPEILRSSLAGVILRMKSLHLGDVEDFPFLQTPLPKMIADGYQLLNELGAVDEHRQLTKTGQELAKLPLDPKIGRMILAATGVPCRKCSSLPPRYPCPTRANAPPSVRARPTRPMRAGRTSVRNSSPGSSYGRRRTKSGNMNPRQDKKPGASRISSPGCACANGATSTASFTPYARSTAGAKTRSLQATTRCIARCWPACWATSA